MANTKIPSELIADNAVGITQLNVSDGSNGQVLTTNGSGALSFSTVSGGGGGGLSGGTAVYMHNGWNNQAITKNVVTKLNMDTVEFGNSESAYNATNKEYTVPSAGQYLFLGNIASDYYSVPAATSAGLYADIYKNNAALFQQGDLKKIATSNAATEHKFQVRIMKVLNLAQNDVIDFRARLSHYGNGANTVDITRGNTYSGSTYMYIIKLHT